uniref:Armadillo repeat containing 5 n=1 Tax=Sphenodon punctatus TaxID=8508 RepID=A0A8D0GMY1_SPHPU
MFVAEIRQRHLAGAGGVALQPLVKALCLLCREAVNRSRIRESGGLKLLLSLLRDRRHGLLHARVVLAFVAFFYDEAALETLQAGGLVPLLVGRLAAQGHEEEEEEEEEGEDKDAASFDLPAEGRRAELTVPGTESSSFQSLRSWLLSEGYISSPGDLSPQWSPDTTLSEIDAYGCISPCTELSEEPPGLSTTATKLETPTPSSVVASAQPAASNSAMTDSLPAWSKNRHCSAANPTKSSEDPPAQSAKPDSAPKEVPMPNSAELSAGQAAEKLSPNLVAEDVFSSPTISHQEQLVQNLVTNDLHLAPATPLSNGSNQIQPGGSLVSVDFCPPLIMRVPQSSDQNQPAQSLVNVGYCPLPAVLILSQDGQNQLKENSVTEKQCLILATPASNRITQKQLVAGEDCLSPVLPTTSDQNESAQNLVMEDRAMMASTRADQNLLPKNLSLFLATPVLNSGDQNEPVQSLVRKELCPSPAMLISNNIDQNQPASNLVREEDLSLSPAVSIATKTDQNELVRSLLTKNLCPSPTSQVSKSQPAPSPVAESSTMVLEATTDGHLSADSPEPRLPGRRRTKWRAMLEPATPRIPEDTQPPLLSLALPLSLSPHGSLDELRAPEAPALLLLSRFSQAEDPSRSLVTPSTLRGLLRYVTGNPAASPRCLRLLHRLTCNPTCLEAFIRAYGASLIRTWLVLGVSPEEATAAVTAEEPSSLGGERCVGSRLKELGETLLMNLRVQADTPFGVGVLTHMLLSGPESDQVACAVALPLVCRKEALCRKLLLDHSGLRLLLSAVTRSPAAPFTFYASDALAVLLAAPTTSTPSATSPSPKRPRLGPPCLYQARLDSGKSDLRFQLDAGTIVPVHRHTLCEASDVFRAMLAGAFAESHRATVALKGVPPEPFLALVHFLHGCRGPLCPALAGPFPPGASGLAEQILLAADRFLLPDLQILVDDALCRDFLHPETLGQVYSVAERQCRPQLRHRCASYALHGSPDSLQRAMALAALLRATSDLLGLAEELWGAVTEMPWGQAAVQP